MRISLKDIKPNPHRDLDNFPLSQTKVEELVKSIKATKAGFWDNVLVRKTEDGYELAYGHHRLEAAKRAGLKDADFIVKPLSDGDMLKVMFLENSSDLFRTPVSVMMENMEATVKALAAGSIEVEIAPRTDPALLRYAPSFVVGTTVPESGKVAYTVDSIAFFLGAVKANGHAANTANAVMNALELIEQKILTRASVLDLDITDFQTAIAKAARLTKERRERERLTAAATAVIAAKFAAAKKQMEEDTAKLATLVAVEAAKVRAAEEAANAKKVAEYKKTKAAAEKRQKERAKDFAAKRKELDAKLASRRRDEEDARKALDAKTKKEISYIVDDDRPKNLSPSSNRTSDTGFARVATQLLESVNRLGELFKSTEGDDQLAMRRAKDSIESAHSKLGKLLSRIKVPA